MERIFTITLILLLSGSWNLFSQEQTVSVGQNYVQQAYYNISTGDVTTIDNDTWDVAFSNAGQADAGVFINESAAFAGTPLKLYVASTTDWSEEITDLSEFVDSNRLHNPEENWQEGAFNTVKDPNSSFDFGWGAYNPQSHQVEGTKIFVIKMRDGSSYLKFQVTLLAGGDYSFRYAGLDGSNEQTAVASKTIAGDSPMIYFSLGSGQTVDIPSDYDLIFQRYTTPIDDGSGNIIQYNVTGVLLGSGTEAVKADGVDPLMVDEADYANQYSSIPTTIGHDWKAYDFMAGWIIDDDRAYFVKTANGEKYKVVFYDFDGSMTGTTSFEKFPIGTTSVNETFAQREVQVFPNPAVDFIQINAPREDRVELQVYNGAGALILSDNVATNVPLDILQDLHNGMFHLVLVFDEYRLTRNLVINK